MMEPSTDDRALQLDGETNTIVFGCGARMSMAKLGDRFTGCTFGEAIGDMDGIMGVKRSRLEEESAVVASFRLIPCCRAYPDAGLMCHMDECGDEDTDRQRLVLALALARAEGEENVATWLATRVTDNETQFPPGVARMLLEYITR